MACGVEKLPRRKIAEKILRWEALQTTISVFVDIFGKRDHAGGNRRVNLIAAFTLMVETKPGRTTLASPGTVIPKGALLLHKPTG
jgi:hypothetical protein